jgi:AcrR family transcriptional regulator
MTERGTTTRARLITATVEVVREVGYAHATTRAIAQRAGVAEGTIYRHFPDKAALFFAAVFERNSALLEGLSGLADRAGERTVEATLTETLLRLASLRAELLPLELALLTDPELARRRRQAVTALRTGKLLGPPQFIADYFRAEQQLGRVRTDATAEDMAVTVLAALFGMALMSIEREDAVDGDLLSRTVRVLVSGIEPSAARIPRGRADDR